MKFVAAVLVGMVLGGAAVYGFMKLDMRKEIEEVKTPRVIEKPLLKYTIENLSQRAYGGNDIVWDEFTATESAYTARKFHFTSDGKRVTGLAHIPQGNGPWPVVVQIRGYHEREGFVSGDGTKNSAKQFSAAGFLSLAPDFLGYGGSDNPSADVFEARFETYTAVLNLLAGIRNLSEADAGRVGLWAHSNGGQIALTVLEVSGRDYPTVLWAPVTARFPYSILYYTGDTDDGGKALRKDLARFERDYDTDDFAMTEHLDMLNTSLVIHQGTADSWVPVIWSEELIERLREKGKEVKYYKYSGADHNLVPFWQTVVDRDIQFFRGKMGLTEGQ